MAVRWPDDDHATIEAPDSAALRAWLEANHETADAVWFRYWKQGSGRPSLTWSEVVDELLCFGWIDTKVQSVDDDTYVQYLTRRKRGSVWSRINKEKVERLTAEGRMTPAGLEVIERARLDGSWTALDAAEALIVPDDLAAALAARSGATEFFESLGRTGKRYILSEVYLAKRPPTRAKRIEKFADSCAAGIDPSP